MIEGALTARARAALRTCTLPWADDAPTSNDPELVLDLAGAGTKCLVRDVLALQPEERLTNLRELRCTGCELTRVDPVVCRSLPALELLCLSANRIRTLPADFGQLRGLTSLRLEGNCLAALPWQLGELEQLQQLWLGCNELTALPASVGGLRRLRELWLVGNKLHALPQSLGQCSRLERLELSDNLLCALPDSVGRLARLEQLWLRGNQLAEVPRCLAHGLPSLTALDLSDNRLLRVPPTVAAPRALAHLKLERNGQLAFPDAATVAAGPAAVLAALRAALPPAPVAPAYPHSPPTPAAVNGEADADSSADHPAVIQALGVRAHSPRSPGSASAYSADSDSPAHSPARAYSPACSAASTPGTVALSTWDDGSAASPGREGSLSGGSRGYHHIGGALDLQTAALSLAPTAKGSPIVEAADDVADDAAELGKAQRVEEQLLATAGRF